MLPESVKRTRRPKSRLHIRLTIHDDYVLNTIRALLSNTSSNAEIVRHSLFFLMQVEGLNRCAKLAFCKADDGRMEEFALGSSPFGEVLPPLSAGTLQIRVSTGIEKAINGLLSKERGSTSSIVRYAIELSKYVLTKQRKGWSFGVATDGGFEPILDAFALMGGNELDVPKSVLRKRSDKISFDIESFNVIDVMRLLTLECISNGLKGLKIAQHATNEEIIGEPDSIKPITADQYKHIFSRFDKGTFIAINPPFRVEDDPEIAVVAESIQTDRLKGGLDKIIYAFQDEDSCRRAVMFFSRFFLNKSSEVQKAGDEKIVIVRTKPRFGTTYPTTFLGRSGDCPVVIRYEDDQLVRPVPTCVIINRGGGKIISSPYREISKIISESSEFFSWGDVSPHTQESTRPQSA